ncbi:hypothetical protein BO221_09540 [Archangium sp. Cb G35]|uniref:cupin domain-containing protein n=1 Tax=Archangium sp. Cb G35 TaxID=1920190 RepID=UPI000936B83F|nr:cupin domain-containing protein [Archangium sp. Cb G35]OJT26061.1 hypothetical protein BO221_09540 [Archangium sp. Cb G35]
MREGVIIGDLEDPSVVHGVHGTTGLSQWKCLARRAGLFGSWEAVEWAWIPPGGISGEHVHTRTEEVYFILSGRGEMTLDGKPHPVGPGSLILTGLGTKHGLRNVGDVGLGWLVIELLSPHTAAVLRGAEPPGPGPAPRPPTQRGEEDVTNAVVLNLRQTYEVNPRGVFTGPLRSIRLVNLKPGQRAELSAAGEEHTLFTLSGSGEISSGDGAVPLKYGVSVTLPLGTGMTVTAGDEGLEYFLASLEVPGGGAR